MTGDTVKNKMPLGAFSVSLAVQDIDLSKGFYQKLGFEVVGGDQNHHWLIMRNGDHTIGLFQGMFENNIMTFNPGWDAQCHVLDEFVDVRDMAAHFKATGVDVVSAAIEGGSGPGSLTLKDPDGNVILIDQHV